MNRKKTLPGTILAILVIGFLVYSQMKKGDGGNPDLSGGDTTGADATGSDTTGADATGSDTAGADATGPDSTGADATVPDSLRCRCSRVVDGDTIVVEISGRNERVRLVGINTPESADPRRAVAWFGKESADYTRKMLEGRWVELQFKPDERRDNHGRMLAYVHRDGEDFCARLIREGYAYSFPRYPHPRLSEYERLQRQARNALRGLWKNHPDNR